MRDTGHIEPGPPEHQVNLSKSFRGVKTHATYSCNVCKSVRGLTLSPLFEPFLRLRRGLEPLLPWYPDLFRRIGLVMRYMICTPCSLKESWMLLFRAAKGGLRISGFSRLALHREVIIFQYFGTRQLRASLSQILGLLKDQASALRIFRTRNLSGSLSTLIIKGSPRWA
jgi:hypothetical protein